MVQDLSYNLCESLMENIGGVAGIGKKTPTPIYLTQWKIVGNSEVHTLPYPDIPQGYTKCKYLEAHGTEYIDLPIGFDNTDEVELTASFTQINISNKYAIAPKRWNNNKNRFGFGIHTTDEGDIFCAAYGNLGGIAFRPLVVQDTNVHLFTYANYLFKLDNSSTVDVSSITFGGTTADLRLFYGFNSPTKCRIYAYHHVKEDETEINLIPCLDDNDVPCLYDTVSGTSFYNDGTGTFGYEVVPQPTEIWSCGEYNSTDGKYHILVQPQGGSIVDIPLTEPLRKVNNVADSIEFPSDTEGKALVTRNLNSVYISNYMSGMLKNNNSEYFRCIFLGIPNKKLNNNVLMAEYKTAKNPYTGQNKGLACSTTQPSGALYDEKFNQANSLETFRQYLQGAEFIYELATPTTELVDAPQIEEAESYTCVISQGGRAVEWSSFSTD